MAYTFDRINSLFRGRDGNADVMGGKGGGSYGALKTSASGDVTDGSTGAATSTGGEAPVPQQMMASSGAAIKRNVSRTGIPGFTQDIRGQIEAGQTGLAGAEQGYRQKYQNQDYGVSAEDINAAVSGNAPDTFQKVATRMATPKYGQVEAFKPEVDTEVEDAALLGSEAGTKRLLARQGGNRYSAGEGAFDTALLRRNKDFSQIADQLSRQGKELSQRATKLQSELPTEAQGIADTKYAAGTEAAQQELNRLATGVIDPYKTKASDINQKRTQYADPNSAEAKAYLASQTAAAKEAAGKDIAAYAPRASRFLDTAAQTIDPTKLYQAGRQISYQDIIDPESVGKFNRIQAMLGQGDLLAPGMGAGEDVIFNAPEYQKLVTQGAQGLRGVEDERQRQSIAQIQNAAMEEMRKYNEGIGEEENQAFTQALNPMLEAAKARVDPQYHEFLASLNSKYPQAQINPEQFINRRQKVQDWRDVLTPEQVASINASFQDLGGLDLPVKNRPDWRQSASINTGALQQFIDSIANMRAGYTGDKPFKQVDDLLKTGAQQTAGEAIKPSPIQLPVVEAVQRGSDYLAKRDPTRKWR